MKRYGFLSQLGVCCSFVLAALLLVSCKTSQAPVHAPIDLFNGKDLNGWQHVLADPSVSRDQVWKIEDRLLKCSGTPIGALYRGPAVQDFHMIVEYRWAPGGQPGNSGIFSRLDLPAKPLPRAIEVQLKHGDAGNVLGLQGKPVAGGQPRHMEKKGHPVAGDISGVTRLIDAENPPGQWNHVEILARGGNYRVWMNGKLVNELNGVDTAKGMVGVQSEGGEIHFRKIQLAPLDP